MAPSSDAGVLNISGNWIMDKTRSTDLDSVFKLQGIGWITRKAVTASTVTLTITQTAELDDSTAGSTELITLQQVLTGGFGSGPERRPLTWADLKHNDTLFGSVIIRSRYVTGVKDSGCRVRPVLECQTQVTGSDIESFLTEAVVMGQNTHATEEYIEKAFIQDFVCSVNSGWTAEQLWALETIGEEEYLTRKVVVAKGTSNECARVFYKRAQ
ncbi:hypothetical protein BDW59DRAFT_175342 [Aspergillus cavernicola]|uniref:Uncharacterized protein n=1 Tax=Aspergillus cavernicola TaxID=176166 RepID=A0ABR4HR06_9EURO